MKHILVFDHAFRLGQYITKCIGPFDTIEEAEQWYFNAKKTWAMHEELPHVEVETILDKDS